MTNVPKMLDELNTLFGTSYVDVCIGRKITENMYQQMSCLNTLIKVTWVVDKWQLLESCSGELTNLVRVFCLYYLLCNNLIVPR